MLRGFTTFSLFLALPLVVFPRDDKDGEPIAIFIFLSIYWKKPMYGGCFLSPHSLLHDVVSFSCMISSCMKVKERKLCLLFAMQCLLLIGQKLNLGKLACEKTISVTTKLAAVLIDPGKKLKTIFNY